MSFSPLLQFFKCIISPLPPALLDMYRFFPIGSNFKCVKCQTNRCNDFLKCFCKAITCLVRNTWKPNVTWIFDKQRETYTGNWRMEICHWLGRITFSFEPFIIIHDVLILALTVDLTPIRKSHSQLIAYLFAAVYSIPTVINLNIRINCDRIKCLTTTSHKYTAICHWIQYNWLAL